MALASPSCVTGAGIRYGELLSARPPALRLYALPFLPVYLVLAVAVTTLDLSGIVVAITLPCVAILHLLAWLSTQWSVAFACMACFSRQNRQTLLLATHVRVVPLANHGTEQICQLHRTDAHPMWFSFQKQKFTYDVDLAVFRPLSYPDSVLVTEALSHGLSSADLASLSRTYGKNEFDIPMPSFSDLFKEQLVAPMFVFQLLCVGLWCLDEYWHYAVFTLFMLLLLETTVVKSRLKNLQSLYDMRQKAYKLPVWRDNKWTDVDSTELYPGDVVAVARSVDGRKCPADLLILRGNCVSNESLLTGESVPKMKQGLGAAQLQTQISADIDAFHVLYGGTEILLAADAKPAESICAKVKSNGPNACIGFVLRSGFGTAQGRLMRVILFSSERMTANTLEAFLFILCLLVFALIASGYVLKKGLEDESRNRWKLVLECCLIITSVVPPELPIQLTLAVTTSLQFLQKKKIFCTEPFRIPLAGKIDACFFDKTGTLTSDDIELEFAALAHKHDDDRTLHDHVVPDDLSDMTKFVLAGCNSLVSIDNAVVGDPLEKAALKGIQWALSSGDRVSSRKGKSRSISIVQRHAFSSDLKRMSVVAKVDDNSTMILTKGSPEILKSRYVSIPSTFDSTHIRYTRQGFRVLSLGYRCMPKHQTTSQVTSLSRDSLERDLTFAGFVVFKCPNKPESAAAIQTLLQSSHRVAMITGDHILTACFVATDLGIATKPCLILTKPDGVGGNWTWNPILDGNVVPFNSKAIEQLKSTNDVCVTGEGVDYLIEIGELERISLCVTVFGRTSPHHKETVVAALVRQGKHILMCGDGTNDVGALKQASVGVALLSHPRLDVKPKSKLEELQDDATTPTLGDASIAAPFTSKTSSVMCTTHIIRQGRCTLVTTLQMFKILALNCLISAYSLSVLYLDGLKFGDTQMTLMGLLVAGLFFCISMAKPLETLSVQRPPTSVFCTYMVFSVIGQFMLHLYCLVNVVRLGEHMIPEKVDLDAPFKPSLINTLVYLMSSSIQLSVFIVNYQGHPWMVSIQENKPFLYCIGIIGGLTVILATGFVGFLNDTFELVEIDWEMRVVILSYLCLDFVGAGCIEFFARSVLRG